MADVFVNADLVAKTALISLENNCVLGNLFYRDYENEWKGVKHGSSVRIRKPVQFVAGNTMAVGAYGSTGSGSKVQDIREQYITLTLDQWRNVTWDFDVEQLTMDIAEIKERYIDPAVIKLVNEIEMSCAGLYKTVFNVSSVADTISATGSSTGYHGNACPRNFRDVGQAAKELNICACPPGQRSLVMDPDAELELSANFTTLNIPAVGGPVLKDGKPPSVVGGMKTYMGQNILKHTAGALCGSSNGTTLGHTITAATTSVFGSTVLSKILIQTSGSTLGLSAGDIFYVQNVYSVNPVSKQSNAVLQKFAVAADVAGVAVNTTMTVFCYPAMEAGTTSTTGSATEALNPYKNITSYPSTTTTQVHFLTDHTANLAFHKNAFALAMAQLEVPPSATFKGSANHNGFAIVVTRGFDILNYKEVTRLDILYGVLTLYPELACRCIGSTT